MKLSIITLSITCLYGNNHYHLLFTRESDNFFSVQVNGEFDFCYNSNVYPQIHQLAEFIAMYEKLKSYNK